MMMRGPYASAILEQFTWRAAERDGPFHHNALALLAERIPPKEVMSIAWAFSANPQPVPGIHPVRLYTAIQPMHGRRR
jgi:hypothetical protein